MPTPQIRLVCYPVRLTSELDDRKYYSTCMLMRAYVGSQGKGSYKHEALISSGSYLLNDEKGSQEKAPISIKLL